MNKITLAALLGSVSADINSDFKAHLFGEVGMDHQTFKAMWAQFESEFGHLSLNKDLPLVERMMNFEDTVQTIIEHNSKPNKTWTQGVNKFSDMSAQQFKDYYHLDQIQAQAA